MKPFLTWLTLGAILFLCSCEESNYRAEAYQPSSINPEMQTLLNTATPAISYSSEIEVLDTQISHCPSRTTCVLFTRRSARVRNKGRAPKPAQRRGALPRAERVQYGHARERDRPG